MPDPSLTKLAVSWIEAHPATVDLVKWALVIIAAWALGLFRLIRNGLRAPRIEIEPLTSRCYCEYIDESDGYRNVARTIFLVQVSVTNPTSDPITVKDFELRYRTQRRFSSWTDHMLPTTIPNRPRQTVGGITKLLRVWFTHYHDDPADLSISGRLDPHDYQTGYVLFVSSTWGDHNPRIRNDKITIEIRAKLTTGDTIKHRATIRRIHDREYIESLVPGVLAVGEDQLAHNITRDRI